MAETPEPPPGFGEPFFRWLDSMAEELLVSFASHGCLSDSEIKELEQKAGFSLPEDLLRFYRRYDPWGVVKHWSGWEQLEQGFRRAVQTSVAIAPIDHGSLQAQASDTVAILHGPEDYEVAKRSRATEAIRIFSDLRAYCISAVEEEISLCQG